MGADSGPRKESSREQAEHKMGMIAASLSECILCSRYVVHCAILLLLLRISKGWLYVTFVLDHKTEA